jgi:hypothetical protein
MRKLNTDNAAVSNACTGFTTIRPRASRQSCGFSCWTNLVEFGLVNAKRAQLEAAIDYCRDGDV